MNNYEIRIKSDYRSGKLIVEAHSSRDAIRRLMNYFPENAVIRKLVVRRCR